MRDGEREEERERKKERTRHRQTNIYTDTQTYRQTDPSICYPLYSDCAEIAASSIVVKNFSQFKLEALLQRTIKHGNAEIGAHVWSDLGYFISLRHLLKSSSNKSDIFIYIFLYLFFFTSPQQVLIYHLISMFHGCNSQ